MKNKLNNLLRWGSVVGVAMTPFLAFGQTAVDCADSYSGGNTTLGTILCKISVLINSIIPILITLAVVYFIWGVISYVLAKEDDAKTKGRDKIIYGLIALLVIVSVWGLVNILKTSFGIYGGSDTLIDIPCIPSPGVECP